MVKKTDKNETNNTESVDLNKNEEKSQEKNGDELNSQTEKSEINCSEPKEEQKIQEEIQSNEEKWLESVLNHPIKTIVENSDSEGEEQKYIIKTVGEIIDPEKDIWYSRKKNKPIIKEPGTRKLIKATGATFPKVIPIQKESDFSSRDREQVWIEATCLFPNGESNEDYGIANRANCSDSISSNILPIMARKRAINRAFFRSDYIGLYDVYDENEISDSKNEEYQITIKQLNTELGKLQKKYTSVIRQLCREQKSPDGQLIFAISDMDYLIELSKGSSLTAYIAKLRMDKLIKTKKTSN